MASGGEAMATSEMCEIDPDLNKKMKKFKLRKERNCAAIIVKIVIKEERIILDEELEDTSLEEVVEELPERQPRYLLFSYVHKHNDGRVSYPQVFIFFSPEGCDPKLQMRYSGCRNAVLSASGMTKMFVVREKEQITEEWLIDQLGFFR